MIDNTYRQRGNGSGKCRIDFDAYDGLHAEFRKVLMFAPRPFSPASIIKSYREHGSPPVGVFVAHMKATLKRRYPGWRMPCEAR